MIYEIEEIDHDGNQYKAEVVLFLAGDPENLCDVDVEIDNITKCYKYLPTLDSFQRCDVPFKLEESIQEKIRENTQLLEHIIEEYKEYHNDDNY